MNLKFKTLRELMNAFRNQRDSIEYFTSLRWKHGQFCPYCNYDKVYTLTKRNRYKCAKCHTHFSIMVGTVFENTKLPLRIWFGAIWLIVNHPKGIASTTIAKELGITQKSAWNMKFYLHHATRTRSFNKALRSSIMEKAA